MQALRRWPRLRVTPPCGGHYAATFATARSPHTQTNRAVITQLLQLVDSEQQIHAYLDELQSTSGYPLAVIAIGSNALSRPNFGSNTGVQLEQLAESLVFLRRVGLFPVILHGELNLEAPCAAKLGCETPGGHSEIIRRIRATNLQISTLLEQRDVETRPLPCNVFTTTNEHACVGSDASRSIASLELKSIESAIRAQCVPIIATLGISPMNSRLHALDLKDAAIKLTRELRPSRSVFLYPDHLPGPGAGELTIPNALEKKSVVGSTIVFKTASELSRVIFATPRSPKSRRGRHSVESVSSLEDFPSQRALRTALERHPDPTVVNDLDQFLSRLESEDFTAYYDHDFTASSPEETIRNLALVFPQTAFPWHSSKSPVSHCSPSACETEGGIGNKVTPELAVFAVSRADWRHGVAERFWHRIRADHGALWGSLGEADPNLSWWRARSTGSFKRRPEDKIFMWHGQVA
ncbi:hypothetical protein PDE_01213 [Penicillium oxalicum 114-2]|uniref:Amino-acid acetyltransferase, mitochondrial n=1 Tax=Penicillium oxalicum (strain 114-2 / CGMCC 5302) TaxID=933388 RepID=S8AWL4_PENO1|nr:hypothetical protein PDE_01213 [Penicillium oxalicum 114-2]